MITLMRDVLNKFRQKKNAAGDEPTLGEALHPQGAYPAGDEFLDESSSGDGVAGDMPVDLKKLQSVVVDSLRQAREMAQAMVMTANREGAFNGEILERMQALDKPVPLGTPADALGIAEFLSYSRSPLQELHEAQVSPMERAEKGHQSSLQATMLVVQAALAEQQNPDHSLRQGERFDARLLEETLDDWVLRGAHRAGCETAPLTTMARTIDTARTSAAQACETRFGCVIPIVVGLHIWRLQQEQFIVPSPKSCEDQGQQDESGQMLAGCSNKG